MIVDLSDHVLEHESCKVEKLHRTPDPHFENDNRVYLGLGADAESRLDFSVHTRSQLQRHTLIRPRKLFDEMRRILHSKLQDLTSTTRRCQGVAVNCAV